MVKITKPVAIARNRKLDKLAGYFLIGLLLPATRLLGILMRRDHSLQTPPRTILFIKLLGLGSLVAASASVRAMRRQFPRTRFILITDSNIARGIAPFGLFDEIWPVDTGNLFSTGIAAVRYLARSWKLEQLWVADLEVYSKLTTVYALLTLSVNRFGFILSPVFFRKYLNTHNVQFHQSGYLEDNYCSMAQAITGRNVICEEAIPARSNELHKPCIVLNNTCSELASVRKLPPATFATICQWLLENTAYQLALLGTAADKKENDSFIDHYMGLPGQKSRIINLAGALQFEEYYRFLAEKGAMIITIDSAPLHIAQKLGLPTLSVWGPTNPANIFKTPAGQSARHLQHYLSVPCSPCIHRYEKLPCGGNNSCMKNITADSIIEKIQVLLNNLTATQSFARYKNPLPDSCQTGK